MIVGLALVLALLLGGGFVAVIGLTVALQGQLHSAH